jgi:hypothetical protein
MRAAAITSMLILTANTITPMPATAVHAITLLAIGTSMIILITAIPITMDTAIMGTRIMAIFMAQVTGRGLP